MRQATNRVTIAGDWQWPPRPNHAKAYEASEEKADKESDHHLLWALAFISAWIITVLGLMKLAELIAVAVGFLL